MEFKEGNINDSLDVYDDDEYLGSIFQRGDNHHLFSSAEGYSLNERQLIAIWVRVKKLNMAKVGLLASRCCKCGDKLKGHEDDSTDTCRWCVAGWSPSADEGGVASPTGSANDETQECRDASEL